jgi:hypothetical protein
LNVKKSSVQKTPWDYYLNPNRYGGEMKVTIFFITAVLMNSFLSAFPPLVEVKAGYFFFTESPLNEIYDAGGIDLQLSASYPIWKQLQLYGSVEFLEKSKKSRHGKNEKSLWEIPLSIGLRPVFPIAPDVYYYFTVGPRYFIVHTHNHSSDDDEKIHSRGFGGFVNTGLLFIVGKCWAVDVFAEYSYKKMHFRSSHEKEQEESVQVGGLTFGTGFAYLF